MNLKQLFFEIRSSATHWLIPVMQDFTWITLRCIVYIESASPIVLLIVLCVDKLSLRELPWFLLCWVSQYVSNIIYGILIPRFNSGTHEGEILFGKFPTICITSLIDARWGTIINQLNSAIEGGRRFTMMVYLMGLCHFDYSNNLRRINLFRLCILVDFYFNNLFNLDNCCCLALTTKLILRSLI